MRNYRRAWEFAGRDHPAEGPHVERLLRHAHEDTPITPSAEVASSFSPVNILLDIAGGHVLSRCLDVVADFGVADVLGDVPLSASDLAEAVGADTDALSRILRLLSAHGIFVTQDNRFSHTTASRLMRSAHRQSCAIQKSGRPNMRTKLRIAMLAKFCVLYARLALRPARPG